MNVENGNTVFQGKGNHSSLTGNGILQELHTTNLCGILAHKNFVLVRHSF